MNGPISIETVLDRVSSEGLGDAILYYYGEYLKSEDKVLNERWKEAYHWLKLVEARLDELDEALP